MPRGPGLPPAESTPTFVEVGGGARRVFCRRSSAHTRGRDSRLTVRARAALRRALVLTTLLLSACSGEFRFGSDDAGTSGTDAGTQSDAGMMCQCSGAFPLCDRAGRCVECVANSDCGSGLCDLTTGRCIAPCFSEAMCSLATFPRGCTSDFGPAHCAACKEVEDCGGATPHCAYTRGVCVQCTQDLDCAGATLHCDVPAGQCR